MIHFPESIPSASENPRPHSRRERYGERLPRLIIRPWLSRLPNINVPVLIRYFSNPEAASGPVGINYQYAMVPEMKPAPSWQYLPTCILPCIVVCVSTRTCIPWMHAGCRTGSETAVDQLISHQIGNPVAQLRDWSCRQKPNPRPLGCLTEAPWSDSTPKLQLP